MWRNNQHIKVCEAEQCTHWYSWTKNGKKNYKRLYRFFRRLGQGKPKSDLDKEIDAAKDCFLRVREASVWKWGAGLRPFFWQWCEFEANARDGPETFVKGPLPKCKERQSVPKDQETRSLVQKKLTDVRRKGYIKAEGVEVKSVTSFFDVPKGNDSIRVVYNATSSGLNDAIWAPWFSLPTIDTHLRAVDPGTYMGDGDIGKMFLNFMLDIKLRPYAGVDLTKLFPEQIGKGKRRLWEHWTRLLMGFKPLPYLNTREFTQIKPFLLGDRNDPSNIFRWTKVILNLPGSEAYTPSRPRVFRVREDGKTMTADLFIYIDDVRNTAPLDRECWAGVHQVCCRIAWLGIQDAPRKKILLHKSHGLGQALSSIQMEIE